MKLYMLYAIRNEQESFVLDSSYCESYEYEPGSHMVSEVSWSYYEIGSGNEGHPLIFNSKNKEEFENMMKKNEREVVDEYKNFSGVTFRVIRDLIQKEKWDWKELETK